MRPDEARVERDVRRFLDRVLDEGLARGEDPFARGAVDSLAMEQFLGFVQDRYGVAFGDDELTAERFGTMASVARSIAAKMRDGDQAGR